MSVKTYYCAVTCLCNRVTEAWGVQIHEQAFYWQTWSANTGRVETLANRYGLGKTQEYSKVIDQRTESRGLDKKSNPETREIVQTRYRQSPCGEARVNPRYTGRNQETRNKAIWKEKTKLEQGSVRQLSLGEWYMQKNTGD